MPRLCTLGDSSDLVDCNEFADLNETLSALISELEAEMDSIERQCVFTFSGRNRLLERVERARHQARQIGHEDVGEVLVLIELTIVTVFNLQRSSSPSGLDRVLHQTQGLHEVLSTNRTKASLAYELQSLINGLWSWLDANS